MSASMAPGFEACEATPGHCPPAGTRRPVLWMGRSILVCAGCEAEFWRVERRLLAARKELAEAEAEAALLWAPPPPASERRW